MHLKGKSNCHPALTPSPFMTLEQLPHCFNTTKNKLTHLKTSIPIKQYSNQFFRQTIRQKATSYGQSTKNSQKKRFNTLMKKQMMSKYTMRHGSRDVDRNCKEGRASMITVKGYCKAEKKRSVTEMQPLATYEHFHQHTEPTDNPQSIITELQQELIVTESFLSNLLSPPSSSLFRHHHQQQQIEVGTKQKTEPSHCEEKGKISQSRGLELFAKLYIKDKSVMVEKPKESHRKFKKTSSIAKELGCSAENSFQTRKIVPIEKTRKKELMSRQLENKKKQVRIPMKMIDNHFTSTIDRAYSRKQDLEDDPNQPFEIKGWDTTL